MTTLWAIDIYYHGSLSSAHSRLFATPFQADTYRWATLSTHPAYSYVIRPATWQDREQAMFDEGVYVPPVWSDEGWWKCVSPMFSDHYVHISLVDPTMVAYTEDARKGEADRQTALRPGKYLQKFLGAGPDGVIADGPLKGRVPRVTKQQIAYYSQWHQIGKRPPSEDTLHFVDDEREMVRVYETGPHSCMSGTQFSWSSHPIRVYAGGGLSMAYLTNASADVIARALCWPARKAFGRVYPTPGGYNCGPNAEERYAELMARLKALGWQSITENNSVFEGALLRRLRSGEYGSWMMPYLDHEYGVEEHYHEGETWWRMTHDASHQDNTDGTMSDGEEEEERWTCESCNDSYPEHVHSHTVYREWRAAAGRHGGGYARGDAVWCDSCRSNDAFYCEGSNEYYDEQQADQIEVGYNSYELNWFEANGGWKCAWSEEYFFKADDPPVVLADGSLIHADNLEEAAFQCQYDGQWWSNELESDAVPGYHVHYDGDAVHPVEVERVVPEPPDDHALKAWGVMFEGGTWPPAAQGDLFIAEPVENPVPVAEEDCGSIGGMTSRTMISRAALVDAIHATMNR